MALAYPHVMFLMEMHQLGHFRGGIDSMLEFGEQNWFGDVAPSEIGKAAQICGHDPATVALIQAEAEKIHSYPGHMFDAAKLFYRVLFGEVRYAAIDMHGSEAAIRHDLNLPIALPQTYALTTNIGTGEHVFNQAQFFRTMHEATRPGGLMLHSLPNQGCYDHGFFNYHPTLVFDLAAANDYEILAFGYVDSTQRPARMVSIPSRRHYVELAVSGQLTNYSALIVLMRRRTAAPFALPQQGYYSNTLPPELDAAWNRLER